MLLTAGAAVAVALAAYAARLLTVSGAVAAALVGAAALNAGPSWVALLLYFFVSSNLLSRWRAAEREALSGGIAEKGDRRDAWQVVANGGVFTLAAVGVGVGDAVAWQAVGAGAIAAATADTWSTEIGTLLGGRPRNIVTGAEEEPGTSGGISVAGSTASLCGALLAGLVVMWLDWSVPVAAVLTGGLAGSIVDSLLGATVQERRWCDRCAKATERAVHRCGTVTTWRGGWRWMTNDVVNLVATLTGGLVAWWYAA